MATATRPGPFARKSHDVLVRDATADPEHGLKRSVGVLDLTALGIGAVIGTGIFVIIGEAIGDAGPSIIISFALAGVTCLFSAFSYAELASSIPVSGSAYTYGYATLGELVAWIIGWDLILEYGVAVAAVAVGWGGYLKSLLDSLFGITIPESIAGPPGEGGTANLPAVFLVLAVSALLIYGVRESARTNTFMVITKVAILIFFVVVGVGSINGDNFSPWAPHGFNGTVDAAALIFFAYIGFDAISTSGEEAENPSRDLPFAIIGALLICTLLYILVAVVTVGLAPASKLAGSDAPLATALQTGAGIGNWAADILSVGALIAITSVTLTVLYGQTRIMFAMSRDGLVPRWVGKLSPRQTPALITATFGVLVAVIAAFVPLLGDRQAGQHRHAVRLPHRQHRRHRPAPHRARHGALLPRPAGAVVPAHRQRAVHLPDDEARGRDVAAVLRLAAHRPRHLLRVRPYALATAARRGDASGAGGRLRTGVAAPALRYSSKHVEHRVH